MNPGILLALGFLMYALTRHNGALAPAPDVIPPALPPSLSGLDRVRALMLPLVKVMNTPRDPGSVIIDIMADPSVNAASLAEGRFQVTQGLLDQADDLTLLGVIAHEVAHDDLGHAIKRQAVYEGINVGIAVLEDVLKGSKTVTPIAGQLVGFAYTRQEEYQADSHGVTLLNRSGRLGKQDMIAAMTWLLQNVPTDGGFFSSHPATSERVEALRRLPE